MIKEKFKLKYFKYFKKHLTFPSSWTSLFVIDSYYAHIIHHNRIKHFEFVLFVIYQLMSLKHLVLTSNWKHRKYDIIVKMLLHCPVQMKGTRT